MDGLNDAAREFVLAKNTPAVLGLELRRCFTLVAVAPHGIQAVGALEGEEIKRLYVHPNAQGGGVGRALVEELEREARSQGRILLRVEASPSSVPFYTALGFSLTERGSPSRVAAPSSTVSR